MSRRLRATLPEPARELISRVTGFQPGDQYFDTCVAYVALHLFDVNGLGGNRNKAMDHGVIDKRLAGLAEKFSMSGQDSKADALNNYLQRLRRLSRSLGGGDAARVIVASSEMDREEAARNAMSSMLMMLLELSESPTALKRGENVYVVPEPLKESKKPPKSQDQIDKELLKAILREDPLVGEHWKTQTGEGGLDSDASDFEDMDINPRAVPNSKDSQLPQGGDASSTNRYKEISATGDGVSFGRLDLWGQQSSKLSKASTRLKVLERHQYWRGDHVISRKREAEIGQTEHGFDIQCSWTLNSALRDSKDFVPTQGAPVMDEVDVIHELFLLLQGYPTMLFTREDGSSTTKYSTKVAVSHLSPGALEAILQPFLESAAEIIELQRAVDKICSAPPKDYGKVIQMFASAIHTELLGLKVFLADKQRSYQRYRKGFEQHMASLIELQQSLSDRLETVHVLLAFLKDRRFYKSLSNTREQACQYSIDVLSSLYENVCDLQLSGDSGNSALFLRLLQQSIQPFLVNLECWLSGQSLDSEFEFLILTAENIGLFSNNFWSDGYYIQTEISDQITATTSSASTVQISPCFLGETSMKQLMYTGKAIRIIQTLLDSEIGTMPTAENFASTVFGKIFAKAISKEKQDSNSTADMNKSFPNYRSILANQYPLSLLSDSVHSTGDTSQSIDYTPNISFKWIMDHELAQAIEGQYLATNSMLKSILFTRSRLLWHLQGMAEFYFMMQGEVMHSFSTTIFSKMKRRRPWCDTYILGSTFNQTASLCDWGHNKFVKIRVSDQAGLKTVRTYLSGLRIQVLEQIEFEYLLPWPLSSILYSTENARQMYGRITCLLFQVKTAKHAMELPLFLKSRPKTTPELRLFWKLRLRFLCTMNDLWSYLMMTVLDVQIKKFHSEIEGKVDLDDMIKLSQKFINVCYERCFLKERTLPLHRSLMTMLSLALKFSALFSTFIQEHEIQNRRPAESQLGNNLKLGNHTNRSGRRVSFNASKAATSQHDLQEGDFNTDSEDESFDEKQYEEDWRGRFVGGADKRKKVTRHALVGDENNKDLEDEDIEMDMGEGVSRAKRPKIGPGFPHDELLHDLSSQKTTGHKKWSHESSYSGQLQAIEQEFNRCGEFLAKSLRVVVSSNAVRGYRDQGRGKGEIRTRVGGQGEGDSNYLDGLILALSS
ncbi:Spc98 family-domain-containing protein [Dissophora ornata]|nr:Spc98 family-domain-containing protein [Dissophora ornata]